MVFIDNINGIQEYLCPIYTVSCELVMRTRDKKVSSRPVSRFPRQGILGVTLRVTIVT